MGPDPAFVLSGSTLMGIGSVLTALVGAIGFLFKRLDASYSAQLQALQAQLAALQQRHEEELARLEARHQQTLERLEARHAASMGRYQAAIEEWREVALGRRDPPRPRRTSSG